MPHSRPRAAASAVRLIVVRVLLIAFASELVVMLVLFPPTRFWLALIDSAASTAAIAPVLWWLVVLPLRCLERRQMGESYEAAIHTTLDGFWLADMSGRLLAVNDAYCCLSGYNRAELLTMSISDLEANETTAETAQRIASLAGLGSERFVSRHRCKDGSLVDVEVSVTYRPVDGGRLFSFFRDLTAQKQAEAAVNEQSRQLEVVFENAPVAMLIVDRERRVRKHNPAAARLGRARGMTDGKLRPGELLGCMGALEDRGLCGLGPACSRCGLCAAVVDAVENGCRCQGVEFQLRVAGPAGAEVLDMLLSTSPIEVAGERMAVVVVEDVTRSRRNERELAARERQYRLLFEGANDAILVLDPESEEILEANPKACVTYGVPYEELVGASLKRFTVDVPRGEQRVRELPAACPCSNFETVHRRQDGSLVSLLVSASVVELRGRRAVLSIHRDVTELRRLEVQLRETQKLEAVGRLAGGVAHDFNNLLQAGMCLADELLISTASPLLTSQVAAELSALHARGASLTRQLLLFARRETANPAPMEVNDLLRGMATLIGRLLKETVTVRVGLAPEPLMLVGDRSQLEQVVMNLALNAADAMPAGGRLVLQSGRRGDRVWLAVEDGGCGIPPELRNRIFEPFFTTKERGQGTGLGLAVVHGIVIAHGGEVELQSEVGKGSTFRILLPAVARQEQAAGAVAGAGGEPSRGNGELVLVVEDQAQVRVSLCRSLARLGYRVAEAGSAEEALALRLDEQPALVLSDVVLPGRGGRELAGELSQRWSGLEVVLMSGYSEDDVLDQQARLGQIRFLRKPFDLRTLARALAAALGSGA